MTTAQMKLYRRAVADAAWALGLDRYEAEEYRKKVLFDETGKESSKDVDAKGEFDAIMARHLADADRFDDAAKYAGGDAKRQAYIAQACAAQIVQLKGGEGGEDAARNYLAGILRQSRLADMTIAADGTWWLDLPAGAAFAVYCMLDKYRRWLLKDFGLANKDLAFSARVRYRVCGPRIVIREGVSGDYYARVA